MQRGIVFFCLNKATNYFLMRGEWKHRKNKTQIKGNRYLSEYTRFKSLHQFYMYTVDDRGILITATEALW